VVIATSAIDVAVIFRKRVSGAQVGIALNIILALNTTLAKLAENWTNLATSLSAVARLKILEDVTADKDKKTWELAPHTWSSNGHIKLTNVTAASQ
jgi:ATP-binding cassette, subfamily C (CFTR/MRP), member 1